MDSGIYIYASGSAPGCNLPKIGDFHADGCGPLYSRAADTTCTVLFEGILTSGREADLADAEIALRAYQQKGRAGLEGLEGFFRLAIVDLRKNLVLVVSDPLATRPLYFYRNRGVTVVSPTPWYFAECGLPMSLDRQGLYQSFRFYHPLSRRTLISEITRSRPLTVYEIHTDGVLKEHRIERLAKEPDDSIDLDGAAVQIKEIMQRVLFGIINHPLLKERSIVLPLTSGQDSRHILGELLEQKRAPEKFRHVILKQCEYNPVRMISDDLGIPLDAPAIADLNHALLTRKWIQRTAGLVNFHQSHLMEVAENPPGSATIGFDGYLCDHLLGLNRRPGMPTGRHFTPITSRLLFSDGPDLSQQCELETREDFGFFEGPENFRVRLFDAFNRGVMYTGAVFPVLGDQALFFAPGAHRLALDFCRRVPESVGAFKRARLRMFQRFFPHLATFPSEYGPPFSETEVQFYKKPSKMPAIWNFAKGMLSLHRTDPSPETNHEWLRRIPFMKRMHRRVARDSALARDKHLSAHVAPALFSLHQAGAFFAFTLMTLTTAEVAYRALVMGESPESICDWLSG